MSIDQIAAITGVHAMLTKPFARQAGLTKETERLHEDGKELTIPEVEKELSHAGTVLTNSNDALSHVAGTLSQALIAAVDAASAPYSARKALMQRFNDLLDETKAYVNNPGIETLTGPHSQPLTVNTTVEGGKLTVAPEAGDANSLGVENIQPSGWNSPADIESSINQIRNALNRITSMQSRYATALAAITAADGVNQAAVLAASSAAAALVGANVGAAVLEEKQGLAEVALGNWSTHVIHRHGHK